MLRRTLWLVLLMAAVANAGGCCCCCCNGPFQRHKSTCSDNLGGGSYYQGCSCGELYIDDWHSSPPRCEPCDHCSNWVGPGDPEPCYQLPQRCGSVMPVSANVAGPMVDEEMSGPRNMAPPQHHCASCGN